jgi:hypothetical protein
MDKAELQKTRGMMIVVLCLEGASEVEQCLMWSYSGSLLPFILGWSVKGRIKCWYCSHVGGVIATQVEMVALNAFVCE